MSRVSAASFIVETDDLWQRRIHRAQFDEAPRVERTDGEARLVCPGDPRIRVPLADVPWIADAASSGDPFIRVPALETEGIRAELLLPTLSWALLSLGEPLRTACLRAYNNWIWNITTTAPRRLFATAILPPGAEAAAELARLAPMGIKAAIVLADSIGRELAELWAASAATGIPLVMARIGGAAPFDDFATFARESAELTRQAASAGGAAQFLTFGPGEDGPANVTYVTSDGAGAGQALWGRLGAPAGPGADDGKAARYFKLPE